MLSVIFSLSFFPAAMGFASELPKVDILYPPGGSLLDRFCTTDLKIPVDAEKIQEAVQRRGQFQEQWNTEGPSYMNTALAQIGLDFPYRELQATLTVCLPASTSVPLVVDVKPFLHSAEKPDPAWEFSEVVFHELMHLYVSPVFATSALMHKYRNEPPTTRYHLHVMAIEKLVLLKLNRVDQLKVIAHDYRSGPDPAYKRAWEIVNDIEGYQSFIDELKALKRAGK
jgi:hypothetical protein